MGYNVDLILDGFLCQFCGEFIDHEYTGYPRSCESCKKDSKEN